MNTTPSGTHRHAWQALLVAAALCGSASLQARCINTGNAAIPHSTQLLAFNVYADGTVLARATGLMWARCLMGQSWTEGRCSGAPAEMRWADAVGAARLSGLAGYSDWRLPNAKEVLSILDDRCSGPALHADLFPIATTFSAWTGTPTGGLNGGHAGAWAVTSEGFTVTHVDTANVLLVRNTR